MEKPPAGGSEHAPHWTSGDFPSMLAQLLHTSPQEKYIQKIQHSPRYTTLSKEEQSCVDCFLTMREYEIKTTDRTARNHRRLDIGAWLVMSNTHTHPQVHQIVDRIKSSLPSLLSTEDRKMLEKLFHIHSYLHNNNYLGYKTYLASVNPEKQSLLIQTYKQMIIAQTVHPNGTSSYFPYISCEKTINLQTPQTKLPDNNTFYEQLTNPTNKHLIPPQSDLQNIFHDIILLTGIAPYIASEDIFRQLTNCWSHSNLGFISNEKYTPDMFYLKNTQTDTLPIESSPEQDPDIYLQHSYLTLQSMRTAASSLLSYRAKLHYTAAGGTTYTMADHHILQQIRETIQTISKLHGRIDLHYFIRHLPSESDKEEKYISSPEEEIDRSIDTLITVGLLPYLLEKELLVCSSERQYALMSTVLFLTHRQTYNIKPQMYAYEGLNNHSKEILQPIGKTKEQRLSNKIDLIRLLSYISVIPSTSVHITHGRVLKRIRNHFAIEDVGADMLPGKTYCLFVYEGVYINDASTENPGKLLILLEHLRSLVHTHAKEHRVSLYQFTQPIATSGTQQLSITAWCYRVVDYLRMLYALDNTLYTSFIEKIISYTSNSSTTLQAFFVEQHRIITKHEHTE